MRDYLHKYFYIIGNKRKKLVPLVGLFLLVSMIELLGIGLVAPFIAMVSAPEAFADNSLWIMFILTFGIKKVEYALIALGLLIVFVFYFKGFMAFWLQKSIARFALNHQSDLICRLMSAYQEVPYHFHLQRNTASLIQAISGHTSNYAHHTLISSLRVLSEVIVLIMILGLLATTNFAAVLTMAFLIGGVFLLYDKVVKNRVKVAGRDAAKASEDIIKGVNQGIGGLKEIRVFGKEHYFHNKVKDSADDYAKVNSRYQGLKIIPRYLFESVIITFVVGLSIVGVLGKETSYNVLPLLGMFGAAAMRLIPSANQISEAVTGMRFSSHAMNDLYADLNEVHRISSNPEYLGIQHSNVNHLVGQTKLNFTRIEVKNISYQYPMSESYAITNLSLSIERGQSIGLIGRSGSGKTTLVNILLGLLIPQEGTIEIDGVSITKDLRKWLDIVAYIPQDIFIIDDTIRRNIAIGIADENIDKEKLSRSIETAQLIDVVNQLPNGIDTYVGERGVRLSGGQRQRVALARSFYHDRDVIIMDEATAALDNETEQLLVKAINNFKADKTMVMIAHRLSTVESCDIIYKLDGGCIIDSGSLESMGKIRHLM